MTAMRPVKETVRRIIGQGMAASLRRRSHALAAIDGPLLVIAPHPDDESLGCGGLIARQVQAGRRVHVVFLTDGEASHAGHPELSPSALAARRREEAIAALSALGIIAPRSNATFLGAPDGKLATLADDDRQALVEIVARWVQADQPEMICAPFVGGGSFDHDAATAIIHDAVRRGGRDVVFEYPIWAWKNAIRLRERLQEPDDNFALELGPLRERKRQAIACHRTQFEPTPPWTRAVMPPWLPVACGGATEFYFRKRVPSGVAAGERPASA